MKNKSLIFFSCALMLFIAASCAPRKKGRGCPSVSGAKNVSAAPAKSIR